MNKYVTSFKLLPKYSKAVGILHSDLKSKVDIVTTYFQNDTVKVPKDIFSLILEDKLNILDLKIISVFLTRLDYNSNYVNIAIEDIISKIGLSKQTIDNSIRRLEKLNIISRLKYRKNTYIINYNYIHFGDNQTLVNEYNKNRDMNDEIEEIVQSKRVPECVYEHETFKETYERINNIKL